MCDRTQSSVLSPPDFSGDRFLQLIEQYHCPRCEGAIAGECVEAKTMNPLQAALPRRRVLVKCEHCDEVFEATFVLLGGQYQIDGGPDVCRDAKARAAMNARIDRVRGEKTFNREVAKSAK